MPASASALRAAACPLLDLLVWIDAPQLLLRHPTIEAGADDAAPAAATALDLGQHTGLQLRGKAAVAVVLVVQRHQLVLVLRADHRGAPAREKRVVDPALRAFPVANP